MRHAGLRVLIGGREGRSSCLKVESMAQLGPSKNMFEAIEDSAKGDIVQVRNMECNAIIKLW